MRHLLTYIVYVEQTIITEYALDHPTKISNPDAEIAMALTHKRVLSSKLREQERRALEQLLRQRLLNDAREAAVAGIPSITFLTMVENLGTVLACVCVISSRTVPAGFTVLFLKGKLHLATERAVLDGPWKNLFDEYVLRSARDRLKKYGRADLIPKD
ncbi:hypothetical protein [Bradyrhizobium sp. USDA 4469]